MAEGVRVLVAEDHPDTALSLAFMLGLEGYQVHLARDGLAAVQAAAGYRPDVAIVDIGLPGMDGYEVARRLRQEPGLGPLLLIALTGHGREEDIRRGREAGFDHYLVKPVEPAELLKLLPPGAP